MGCMFCRKHEIGCHYKKNVVSNLESDSTFTTLPRIVYKIVVMITYRAEL